METERKFAMFGRRAVSKETFMKEMGISEEDMREPDIKYEAAPLTAKEMKELGNKAFQKGYYQEAVEWYSEALHEQLESDDIHMLHSNRSAASSHLGGEYLSLAQSDAEKCIELKPNWFKGYGRKADALMAQGMYKEALPVLEIGLRLSPGNKGLLKAHQKASKHNTSLTPVKEYRASEVSAYRNQNRGRQPASPTGGFSSYTHFEAAGICETDSSIASTMFSTTGSSIYSNGGGEYPSKVSLTDLDLARPVRKN